jgi:hypothetical protein
MNNSDTNQSEQLRENAVSTSIELIKKDLEEFREKLLKSIEERTVSKWEVNDLDTLIYKIEKMK